MEKSQTACPTRWVEMAKHFKLYLFKMSHRERRYASSSSALSTSKWSPQHASSRPSKPHALAFCASVSSGKSAHCPVKRVTGRAIILSFGKVQSFKLKAKSKFRLQNF